MQKRRPYIRKMRIGKVKITAKFVACFACFGALLTYASTQWCAATVHFTQQTSCLRNALAA